MMRRMSLALALTILAAVPTACGSDDDGADVGGAGAGIGGTDGGSGVQLDAGAAGTAAGPPPCENIEGLANQCPHQVALPTAGAGGGLSAPSCVIQLEFEDFNPNMVNVAVDCGLIPHCASDYDATDECWQYDDPDQPTAIVLSEALCARVTDEGFTRIDIVAGCGGPIP